MMQATVAPLNERCLKLLLFWLGWLIIEAVSMMLTTVAPLNDAKTALFLACLGFAVNGLE